MQSLKISLLFFALVFVGLTSGAQFASFNALDSLNKKHEYDLLIKESKKNLELINPNDSPQAYTWSTVFLAKGYIKTKELEKIPAILEKCYSLYTSEEDKKSIYYADLFLHNAKYYYEIGDRDNCLNYLFKGEAALIGLEGSRKKLDQTYTFINEINYKEGDYYKGLEYGAKHLKLVEEQYSNDDSKLAKVNYIIGINLSQLDMDDSSAFHLEKAGHYWEKSKGPDFPYLEYVFNELGQFAWDRGEYDEAFLNFAKAARFYSDDDSFDEISDDWIKKGSRLTEEGKLDEAYDYYLKALEHRQNQLGLDKKATVGCYNSIVEILIKKTDHIRAVEMCQKALAVQVPDFNPENIYENPKNVKNSVDLHYLFGIIQQKLEILNNYDSNDVQASLACEELIELGFDCLNELQFGKRTEEIKKHWGSKALDFFEVALDYYYKKGEGIGSQSINSLAFSVMDRSKSYLLSEAISGLEAESISGISTEILIQEKSLKEEIYNLQLLLSKESKKCEAADLGKVNKWKEQLSELRNEFDRFNFDLQKEYPDYYYLKYTNHDLDIKQIQSSLAVNQAIVEYFVGQSYLYTITLTRDFIDFKRTKLDESFNINVSEFYTSVNDQEFFLNQPQEAFDQFVKCSDYLHDILIDNELLNGINRLIIIPDGILNYVPFELLNNSDILLVERNYQKINYLLHSYSISYSNSASLWLNYFEQINSSSNTYMGVAPAYAIGEDESNKRFADGIYPPLKFNSEEVNNVHRLLGGDVLIGANATENNFKSSISEYGLLHMAMHTVVDREHPLTSAFLFDRPSTDSLNDDYLHTSEIYNLKLNAQLTILSSCNTGIGELDRGEGLMSLSRAFAYAGCPSVVMSLWPCDDKSTNDIILFFVENLKNGDAKDIALKKAKLKYLEGSSRANSHPFYWAHLNVNGSTMPMNFETSNRKIWFKIAGAISLVLILIYLRSFFRTRTSSRRN